MYKEYADSCGYLIPDYGLVSYWHLFIPDYGPNSYWHLFNIRLWLSFLL